MTRSQKLAATLVAYLPVLALLVAGTLYVKGQVDRVLRNAHFVLAAELSQRWGKEVRVGRLEVGRLGHAVIRDVEIPEGAHLSQGRLLYVKEVRLRYDALDLLLGKGAQSFTRIDAIEPEINLIRRPDGSLNIVELFKAPPGPERPPFRGVVVVTGARGTLKDYGANTRYLPAVNQFTRVSILVDARRYPNYAFSADGRGQAGRLGATKLVGTYRPRTKAVDIDLDASDVSAAYWVDYVGAPAGVRILDGKLGILAGANIRRRSGRLVLASADGVLRAIDVSAKLEHLRTPVRRINGTVVLGHTRAAASLSGFVGQSPVKLTGLLGDFEHPRVDITVLLPRADFASLAAAVGLPRAIRTSGIGSVRARITGLLADPVVEATLNVPSVFVRDLRASGLLASVVYAQDRLDVQSARFRLSGADVRAVGTIALQPRLAISLQGRVSGLDTAPLARREGINLAGVADAEFTVSGPLLSPAVAVSASVRSGSVEGIDFGGASGRFEVSGGAVRIGQLAVADLARGVVRARGIASGSSVALDVEAESVDVGEIASRMGYPGSQGIGYFRGRVSGSPRDPTVVGTAELFNGRYEDYTVDYARAAFSWKPPNLRVTESVVRAFPAELALAADVTRQPAGRYTVRAEGTLERMRAEQLVALVGRADELSGLIDGVFSASGVYVSGARPGGRHFVDVAASGHLKMQDATAYGVAVESAEAGLEFSNGILQLADAVFRSGGATLLASGRLSLDTNDIGASLKLSNFDLTRVRDRLGHYLALGGLASGEGTVSGTWDTPNVAATGTVKALTVNAKPFDEATLALSYSHGVIDAWKANLVRGASTYSVDGTGYDIAKGCLVSATARLEKAAARDLWDMFRGSPYLATEEAEPLREFVRTAPRIAGGVIDGALQLTGSLDRPDGSLVMSATNVGIDIQKIESVDVVASASEGVVKLEKFLAVSQDLNVSATGDPFYNDGVLHVELTAQNLDLERLRPWLGENTPGGVMSAEFIADGEASAPRTIGSVEVVDPSYRGIKFDRFRASNIEVEANRVQLAGIILAADRHQAVAGGYLPWNWSTLSVPSTDPIELTAGLDQQDLSLLSVFWPIVDGSKTRGPVRGELRVTGSTSNPQLSGELTVRDGVFVLNSFTNEFRDVLVDLSFDGNQVLVNQLSANSSLGGRIGVEPGGYVEVGGGALANLLLFADGLVVGERNLLGYREDVQMRVDAGVAVTGNSPNLLVMDSPVSASAGGITISNAMIAFALPEIVPEHKPRSYSVDPSFNLSIRLGDRVVIEPPSMSLAVSDRGGTLLGSLSKPELALELEVDSGVLRLAGARVRIVPGGRIAIAYSPPTVDALVSFQATTALLARSHLGRLDRYEVTLTVSGAASDPHIDLSSRPVGLSREQMLAALGHIEGLFASAESGLKQDIVSVLTAVGTSTLFGPIESLFVEKLGFEQFSLEYSSQSPLGIYVSRRLFGNFYVAYFQRLSQAFQSVNPAAYQFTFSYRLRRTYEFSVSVDSQQTTTAELSWTRSFD